MQLIAVNKIIKEHLPYKVVSPSDGKHYFFGYYNLCPWSADGSRLLVHQASFADRFPDGKEAVQLGFLDARTASFTAFADSYAWNFQQGAKLQWVTSSDGKSLIMHNDFREGRLVSIIRDSVGNEIKQIEYPFYAVSPSGNEAVGFSFVRINSCRPEYGYPILPSGDLLPDAEDGLWRIDLETGQRNLLVSIDQVKRIKPNPAGERAKHYFIHAVYNQSGTRLLFLHRFEREDGITQTRLFTAASDGSQLRLLMEGMISHFDWYDDATIFAWAGKRSLLADTGSDSLQVRLKRTIMKGLKPVYYTLGKPRFLMVKIVGDSYHFIPDVKHAEIRPYMKGVFLTDGHCTFNHRGAVKDRWLLTDGYPDSRERLPLYLCNIQDNQVYEIGLFPCPKMYDGDIRVDLHPRFNRECNQVCIDMVNHNYRAVATLDVTQLIDRN